MRITRKPSRVVVENYNSDAKRQVLSLAETLYIKISEPSEAGDTPLSRVAKQLNLDRYRTRIRLKTTDTVHTFSCVSKFFLF